MAGKEDKAAPQGDPQVALEAEAAAGHNRLHALEAAARAAQSYAGEGSDAG